MYKDAVVAAIVPAFNEAQHIENVIRSMPGFVDHIIVVDDCSTDATAARARAVQDPRLIVITHEENQGVGGAILTGHRASNSCGSDVNVVMAGDGQMDPTYLSTLLDPVVDYGYGFAKANRFFSMTSFSGMPKHRLIGSLALSFATKFASGYWHLFDPQNGYTALHRDALDRLTFERLERGYSFENDLLIQLNILRVPAVDVPIPAVYGTEISGIRLRQVVPQLATLLFCGFWKRFFYKYVLWSFSPIALFLLAGLAFVSIGLAVGAWVVAHTLGEPVASTGSVLLAVTPFIVGTNMVMYALLLDIQESPDLPVASRGLPEHWNNALLDRRHAPPARGQRDAQRPAPQPASRCPCPFDACAETVKATTASQLLARKRDAVEPEVADQEHDALGGCSGEHKDEPPASQPSIRDSDSSAWRESAEHDGLPEGEKFHVPLSGPPVPPDEATIEDEGRDR